MNVTRDSIEKRRCIILLFDFPNTNKSLGKSLFQETRCDQFYQCMTPAAKVYFKRHDVINFISVRSNSNKHKQCFVGVSVETIYQRV
jgi:hypothetical protein